jgi:hypothetical protein
MQRRATPSGMAVPLHDQRVGFEHPAKPIDDEQAPDEDQ